MEIRLDYSEDDTSLVVVRLCAVTEEWRDLYEFVSGLSIPTESISYSTQQIRFPWRYLLQIKKNLNDYLQLNDVVVRYTDETKRQLDSSRYTAYGVSISRSPRTEAEILRKLLVRGFARSLTRNQINNLVKISHLSAAATFSVPGAGKTTEALAYFFVNADENSRLLVVAPKNAFGAWEEQLSCCLPTYTEGFVRLRGGEAAIDQLLRTGPKLMLVTYDQFHRVRHLVSAQLAAGNVFMFLDESHRIKGGEGRVRTDAILATSYLPVRKLVMSGTPMPQDVKDILPQFTFLYPEKNVDENTVIDVIRPVFVRTTKAELGITPIQRKTISLPMSQLEQKIYKSFVSDIQRGGIKNVSNFSRAEIRRIGKSIMKVMQFVSNPVLLAGEIDLCYDRALGNLIRSEDGTKIKYVCRRVRELVKEGKKVLVWSAFVKNVELIAERLSDIGADYIHGGVDTGDEDDDDSREGKIKRFHDLPSARVLVANPAACSEGISLHKVCHTAIYMDRSFNAAHYMQSEDRIHRLGLPANVHPHVEIVECVNTIDQIVSDRLKLKIERMAAALDDHSLTTVSDFEEIESDDSLTADDIKVVLRRFFGE